jgi:site-specific DNA-methyltransferase (adenine-specific)
MAMFPPQLPHYFIQRFTKPGDVVLDPFCGRGTTPVQAASQSRHGIGNDLNHLAYVLTKGKLANPDLPSVLDRLIQLENNYHKNGWSIKNEPDRIKMIFHQDTLRQLLYLYEELDWENNNTDSFITMLLMGAMHGSSQGFLSVPMPNTFSMSPNYVKTYIKKHRLVKPRRNTFSILEKRARKALKLGRLPGSGKAILGDARDLSSEGIVEPGSVKLLFSSPPYLKVIKYGQYNWIRLWWLLDNPEELDEILDDAHSIEPYLQFFSDILTETLSLLDPDTGLACWVIGDVGDINLAAEVWKRVGKNIQTADANGNVARYKKLGIVGDRITESEKVTRIWNSEKDKSGKATSTDRILMICHEDAEVKPILRNNQIEWRALCDH